jgi:hypothetical protein
MFTSNVEYALVSLDHHSMLYNCSILHLASCAGEVCWDLFPWWVHWLFTLFSASLLLWTWSLFIWSWSKRDIEVLCHDALVTTCVCFIMMFVSRVVMTFSWMVSTPSVKWAALMFQFSCWGTCLVSLPCLWDFLVLRGLLISLSPIVLSKV